MRLDRLVPAASVDTGAVLNRRIAEPLRRAVEAAVGAGAIDRGHVAHFVDVVRRAIFIA